MKDFASLAQGPLGFPGRAESPIAAALSREYTLMAALERAKMDSGTAAILASTVTGGVAVVIWSLGWLKDLTLRRSQRADARRDLKRACYEDALRKLEDLRVALGVAVASKRQDMVDACTAKEALLSASCASLKLYGSDLVTSSFKDVISSAVALRGMLDCSLSQSASSESRTAERFRQGLERFDSMHYQLLRSMKQDIGFPVDEGSHQVEG